MKPLKLCLLIIFSILFSYGITLLLSTRIFDIVLELSIVSVGILAGIIIGSAGVFIGSLGSLYTVIGERAEKLDIDPSKAFYFIRQTTSEIKQNTILLVIVFILLFLFKIIPIPDAKPIWFFLSWNYFGLKTILCTFSLSLMIFSFIGVIDTINAMFKLNDHFLILAMGKKTEKP